MFSLRSFIVALVLAGSASGASAWTDPQEMPQVRSKVEPNYPAIMLAAGKEGEAIIRVWIDARGTVEKAEVVKATDSAFGTAALEAVRQWTFTPALHDGQPVKAQVNIPVKFALSKEARKSKGEALRMLQDLVVQLLEGKNPPAITAHLGTEAYIAIGSRYEHLAEVIGNPSKLAWLVEGPSTKVLFSRLQTFADDHAGYLVIRTKPNAGKPDRYHTIVVTESDGGVWKIAAWQAGSL